MKHKVLYIKKNLRLSPFSTSKGFAIHQHWPEKRGVSKISRTCGHPVYLSVLTHSITPDGVANRLGTGDSNRTCHLIVETPPLPLPSSLLPDETLPARRWCNSSKAMKIVSTKELIVTEGPKSRINYAASRPGQYSKMQLQCMQCAEFNCARMYTHQ